MNDEDIETLINNRRKLAFHSGLVFGKVITIVRFTGAVAGATLATGSFSQTSPGATPYWVGWANVPEISSAWGAVWDFPYFMTSEAPATLPIYIDVGVGDNDYTVAVLNTTATPITVNCILWLYSV